MNVILGIDVGTSSVKAMLLDAETGSSAMAAKEYTVAIPKPGYAEQDPAVWWNALKEVLYQLKTKRPGIYNNIAAIGLSGQMHGLVLVDADGMPVRPAILWLDQRTKPQIEEIQRQISEEEMGTILRNRVSTGFAFPSLLWVKEHEPETLKKAFALLCPKDYLRMKLTGEAGMEAVDASSTCIFSTAEREWAWKLIERFSLPGRLFLDVSESDAVAGYVTKAAAEETGLPEGVPVIFGAGDQPMQSIGNGACHGGELICNLGTGGQISSFVSEPVYDDRLRTNTFCHAVNKGYTIFGATLCGGMSMNWAKNKVFHLEGYDLINNEAAAVPAGSDGLIYLPYLSGERTPHMDPDASGMFFGLKLAHERGHFLRAVMEGVTYSLYECLQLMQKLGVDADKIIASGGGAASGLWQQIQADVFDKPVQACTVREQGCLGACILAGAGCGILSSVEEGIRRFVAMSEKIYVPDSCNHAIYEERYEIYKKLYLQTKTLM